MCTPHKKFQTCHAKSVIDAEIAEKGHLWNETIYRSTAKKMPAADAWYRFSGRRGCSHRHCIGSVVG